MQNTTTPLIINLGTAYGSTKEMAEYLIKEKLFHSYCTEDYKNQEDFISRADIVIKDRGILFFFSFADTFAEYLNKNNSL